MKPRSTYNQRAVYMEFEPTFYVMWVWTTALLAGLFYVAVQHL